MSPSSALIRSAACLSLAFVAFSAQAQTIIYNFGTESGTLLPTSDTIDNIAGSTSNSANRVAGSSGTTSISTPSSGYTGASGAYNYAINGIVGGSLNLTTSTYFTLTLTPSAGLAVQLTGLTFGARIANVPETPTSYSIYVSDDAFASSTSIGSGTFTKGVWALNSPTISTFTADPNSALAIRIYFYGGTADSTGAGHNRFDDVTITAQAVPEPSTIAFLALGGLGIVLLQSRHRRRRSIGPC